MTIELAEKWMDERGIDIELAAKMGWGAGTSKDGKAWLKIPYVRDGETINEKFRALDEKKFLNTPGAERDLWNVDILKDDTLNDYPLIVTEGEADAISLIQSGFIRTVSIPDGWTAKLEDYDGQPKFDVLKRNEKLIKGNRIIVAGDNDEVGMAFVRAVANFFDEDTVLAVRWPEGCKDANDCLRLHGVPAVVRCVNAAEAIDPPGGVITGFSDLPLQPPRDIWKLGLPDFEGSLAFRSREISVLTGFPGVGKTTFLTWCLHHLVRDNDIRVGAILMESDYRQEVFQHLRRLRGWDDVETHDVEARLDRNYRLVSIVETEDVDYGMLWLKRFIHKLAARDGCNLIVLDPWNELEHIPEPGESMTNYINFALKKLRQWAAKYNVHIMVVAHPRKMQAGEKLSGYSIADSAGFFNKAGMGWALSEEEDEDHGPHIILRTWKVRSRQQTGCRPGILRMVFDEGKMVYRRWSPSAMLPGAPNDD